MKYTIPTKHINIMGDIHVVQPPINMDKTTERTMLRNRKPPILFAQNIDVACDFGEEEF